VINNVTLLAFCIFHASKSNGSKSPISIRELAKTFVKLGHRVNQRLIIRDALFYNKVITTKHVPHKSEDHFAKLLSQVINSELLADRMKKKTNLWSKEAYYNRMLLRCREILSKLTSIKRGGRNPHILAGSVIYLADKLLSREYGYKATLTQQIISQATDIAEYSIRDHFVTLLKPTFISEKN